MIDSKAFAAIRTATAHRVLLLFYRKRQMYKTGRSGKEKWVVSNNGEITFTYDEANSLSITTSTFRNAIDELRRVGFIDIAQSGAGLYKSANLYEISNRWKLYGLPEYQEPKKRPKGPINKGFSKGNQHGRNCKKKKTTVKD